MLSLLFLALALLLVSGLLAADPGPSTGPFTVSTTLQSVAFREMATGLGPITAIAHSGDSRLYLALKNGKVLLFDGEIFRSQPFLDISERVRTDGFEQGMLSIAFHPHYADNGFFYVTYNDADSNDVLARFQRSAGDPDRADPASGKILLTIPKPFNNHNGGQLQFGPDGYLYLGIGDGGDAFDPACNAQRTDRFLGKLLRLDVDQNVATAPYYGIPASNPFRGPGDPRDEIWAEGLRNPWRFSFDRETGDLWIGDVGQNHREEIDFQSSLSHGGENYGWKVMEGTLCSTSESCPGGTLPCNDPTYTRPVLEYDHAAGCSITGGYVYRGSSLPNLRGSYFFGDFCTGTIWLAAPQGSALNVRKLAASLSSLSTFGEDAHGELYAATLDGGLYFLAAAAGAAQERVGLFEPAASRFHLRATNAASSTETVFRFGGKNSGWQPLAGDWDGDGKATIGFFDPRNSLFRLKNSLAGGAADVLLRIPAQPAGALAVTGDWNGDGTDTVGIYIPSTGTFRVSNSPNAPALEIIFNFGPAGAGLIPLAGDWDGDGRDTVGVYDPATSTFYLANGLAGGAPDFQFAFGAPSAGLRPLAGDWNGDRRDTVAVYSQAKGIFQLRNSLSAGPADLSFSFGTRRAGWLPLAGAW
jgi:glucose/arabinose dehydrogenase